MPEPRYQKGDRLADKWEVEHLLGAGGFGEVYLAINLQWLRLCALKTIRSDLIASVEARELFKNEALLWLGLGDHEFIVSARWVTEICGHLIVEMDYIAPDEGGRVSLSDHLSSSSGPLETDRIMKWAIEFCFGMEHANRCGMKCHQDIKPSNILITRDGTLKISDFGLAEAARKVWREHPEPLSSRVNESCSFSFLEDGEKRVCGTPGYIAPELFQGNEPTVKSDIYSFGLVLWQLAAGSTVPPFHVPFRGDVTAYISEVFQRQMLGHFPAVGGDFQQILELCLAPRPNDRPASFEDLRIFFDAVWPSRSRQNFDPPQSAQHTSHYWMTKGSSLSSLGRHEEALACLSRAIDLDPRNLAAWNNKGLALMRVDRVEDAADCFSKALELDPCCAPAWSNKGEALHQLAGRTPGSNSRLLVEATLCFEKAIELDPKDIGAWHNKGLIWSELGCYEAAVEYYSMALEADPRNTGTLCGIAKALYDSGQPAEAAKFLQRLLEIDPLDGLAWNNLGMALLDLGDLHGALDCFDKAIEIDRDDRSAWSNKGFTHGKLFELEEAIRCYDQQLRIQPGDATAWSNKGITLNELGLPQEAIYCFDEALAIDRRRADIWYNRALAYRSLGDSQGAAKCLRLCVDLAENLPAYSALAAKAKERLQEIGPEF